MVAADQFPSAGWQGDPLGFPARWVTKSRSGRTTFLRTTAAATKNILR